MVVGNHQSETINTHLFYCITSHFIEKLFIRGSDNRVGANVTRQS
jgi:hypothetical protein